MLTTIKRLSWSVTLFFLLAGTAVGAAHCYYRIHIDSFRTLEDANRKAKALKESGEIVFLLETDMPGEGKFYKLYLGKYENRAEAIAYWKRLNKENAVSHFGIHLFSEPPLMAETEKTDQIRPAGRPDSLYTPSSGLPENRFVDHRDGTVSDRQSGLMWIKNGWKLGFMSAMSWFDAMAKVEAFRHGNYRDWRLPTVSEWSSLIDTHHRNPAIVEPNPFENMISHMPYWSRSEFTYGQDHTCNRYCPFDAYIVTLYSGDIGHQKKSDNAFVFPVRTIVSPGKTE